MLRSLLLRRPSPSSFSKDKLQRSVHTFTPDIDSLLGQCSNFKHIYQTHAFMVSRGLDQDNLLLSKFVDACSINGLFGYGHSVFAHKTHPNIYLYNNVIKALSQADSAQLAINSNVVTALIQMYSYHGFATEAYNLFEEMPYRDLIMWNAMIAGCVKVMLR